MLDDGYVPLITIGMPTFNREWSLQRVLDSMLLLDYEKKRIRVCFVDNNSTDNTLGIIERFKGEHEAEYEGVHLEVIKSNISKARNVAFELAEGSDYVFFLDSDILVPPDTIRKLLAPFMKDPRVGMASLPWDTKNAKKRAGLLFNAFDSPIGPHEAYKVGNGCNLVSLKAATVAGFFDERLRVHEDGEFCYRLRKRGYRVICDSSSEGTHLRDMNVTADFYMSFMKDSAETYRIMLADGSPLHFAKIVTSISILATLVLLVLYHTPAALALFAVVSIIAIWLNTSRVALDDGSHVRLVYRPVVGVLLTVATVIITLLVLTRPVPPNRAG